MNLQDIVDRLRAGEPRALGRALSLVENGDPAAQQIVEALFTEPRDATLIGLTGPPGVGKSTLADALAKRAREKERRVGVLAIDPTSPFTGGALLGDRARMGSGSLDAGVFIRSMATRGHVGGLASAAFEALVLLEAAGKDFILVETVGAGQDEVEVAAAVDVTVVVLAPGLGDHIQASKAGLLEVADVFVVNKADREGAGLLTEELRVLGGGRPVFETVATRGDGVDPLFEALVRPQTSKSRDGHRRLMEAWLWDALRESVRRRISTEDWNRAVDRLSTREVTPRRAADELLNGLGEEAE